jgi:aspartyl-tRNA(Asn)/glutamyl-tRNA(Gln) amidotransferase subunit C
MREPITPEIFAHMVELAALELAPEETEYLRRQLNNQLRAIDELALIQLDESIPATSHGVPYTDEIRQQPRPDESLADPQAADILTQAPVLDEGYIVVPEIPHTELD